MPDSRILNEPTLIEARKAAERTAKRLKALVKAKRSVVKKSGKKSAKAKKPIVGLKKGITRGIPKRKPTKKDWLSKPVVKRSLSGLPRSLPVGKQLPTKISVSAMRGAKSAPVGGTVEGVEMIPVVSSNVGAIGYDAENSVLYVRFLGGDVYRYYGVPEDVWSQFQTAPSKGKFVWRALRDQYSYDKIG